MVERRLDAKWSVIQMPFEYRTTLPFEYRTNGRHLVFYVLVRYSNGPSSTRTVSDHLNTKPFEFQTSNVSGIQVVCIQIPTVFQTADVHGTLENKTAVLNVPRQSKRKLWC